MKKTFIALLLATGLIVFFTGSIHADSIIIPASEFVVGQPGTSDVIHYYHGTYFGIYDDATYRYFYAPVFLPHGAQVTSVIVFFEDDSTYNITVQLSRRNMYTGSIQNLCSWTSSSNTSGWQTHKISPISLWSINTTGYAYYLYVYFSGSSQLSELSILGVRINYNAP